jgi:Recombinase
LERRASELVYTQGLRRRKHGALVVATTLVQELNAARHRTKRGKPFDKGVVYKLLNNPTYTGRVSHKGVVYEGEHEAIIERDTWERSRRSWPKTVTAVPVGPARPPPRCSRA